MNTQHHGIIRGIARLVTPGPRSLLRDPSGVRAVLLMALIVVPLIISVLAIAGSLGDVFEDVAVVLENPAKPLAGGIRSDGGFGSSGSGSGSDGSSAAETNMAEAGVEKFFAALNPAAGFGGAGASSAGGAGAMDENASASSGAGEADTAIGVGSWVALLWLVLLVVAIYSGHRWLFSDRKEERPSWLARLSLDEGIQSMKAAPSAIKTKGAKPTKSTKTTKTMARFQS